MTLGTITRMRVTKDTLEYDGHAERQNTTKNYKDVVINENRNELIVMETDNHMYTVVS